jgi:hypothetical protein
MTNAAMVSATPHRRLRNAYTPNVRVKAAVAWPLGVSVWSQYCCGEGGGVSL